MATTPAFAAYTLVGANSVSASADNVYGSSQPSHAVLIATAPSNGCKIDEIDVNGTGTTSACEVTLWLYNGTTYFLWSTVTVSAVSVSSTQAPFATALTPANLVLPGAGSGTGWSLYASCTVASQPINVIALGGSY